MHILDKWPW